MLLKKFSTLINYKKDKRCPSDLATSLKVLSPKQLLQRLPIALVQVKAGNTSQNLVN